MPRFQHNKAIRRSRADRNCARRAKLNCPFDVLPERFRRLAVQYDNDAVAFALVEHLWRAYHALPGSTASSLIDLNPHFRPRAGAIS